jgi:multidrug efflux pump subunit AcrA (membrane-fusion protein)
MLVRATLSLKETFSSLAVSKDAIVRQGNQSMVYTINEGKAAPIPVTTTSTNGELIAVAGPGLAEGMPVVVRGNERIFPGAPVMTADGANQNQAPKN